MILKSMRILVLGDVMLDRYVRVEATRLSPEAPGVVGSLLDEQLAPGGAANVAANVMALGGKPFLTGMVGMDTAADELKQTITGMGFSADHLVEDEQRVTTVKTRFTANSHLLFRYDVESNMGLSEAAELMLSREIDKCASEVDAIVVSDYGKGVITPRVFHSVARVASSRGIELLVDGKNPVAAAYRGATVVTPNLAETFAATQIRVVDEASALEASKRLREMTSAQTVVIKRGGEGAFLYEGGAGGHVVPAERREVYDVTGAGDTFIAALAMALASGHSHEVAVRAAVLAGSIVVGKIGTAVLTAPEFQRAWQSRGFHTSAENMLAVEDLILEIERFKRAGKIIGFTNGCFDLLHSGHIWCLERAKRMVDVLIVAVNTDDSVNSLKGASRPVQELSERMTIIGSLACTDFVIPLAQATPIELLQLIQPHYHFKGGDYGEGTLPEASVVRKNGGRVVIIDRLPGRSTTELLEKMEVPNRIPDSAARSSWAGATK